MKTEQVREAIMRLHMCACRECEICKYKSDIKDKMPSESCKERATQNANILAKEFLKQIKKAEWILPREELPPDGEEVLVLTQSKKGVRNIDKGYWAIDHFIHRGTAQVIGWMRLPDMYLSEEDDKYDNT